MTWCRDVGRRGPYVSGLFMVIVCCGLLMLAQVRPLTYQKHHEVMSAVLYYTVFLARLISQRTAELRGPEAGNKAVFLKWCIRPIAGIMGLLCNRVELRLCLPYIYLPINILSVWSNIDTALQRGLSPLEIVCREILFFLSVVFVSLGSCLVRFH